MLAKLVYDGGGPLSVPSEMGFPRSDQLQGTVLEQLCELAGRVCYDSLGSGRPSFDIVTVDRESHPVGKTEGYHTHIRATNNGSVWEHAVITITIWPTDLELAYAELLNRPGVYTVNNMLPGDRPRLIISANLRAIYEWEDLLIGNVLRRYGHRLAPHIIANTVDDKESMQCSSIDVHHSQFDELQWVTLFMSGSRGFSHEQVRHKWRTAVSQRSTRYCDESESEWINHPLLTRLLMGLPNNACANWTGILNRHTSSARDLYKSLAGVLQELAIENGVGKTTARKQARGAARGYLGNALQTEMLFSASVAQWKRMLLQRLNPAADAEIRQIYCDVLKCLQLSRYSRKFEGITVEPSPDGIGQVLTVESIKALQNG
jgi:thymidylate synthase ThyX